VNGDLPWPSAALSGVVSDDRRQALYVLAQLTGAEQESPTSVRLPGLAADVDYRVTLEHPLGEQPVPARVVPPWLHDGEVVVPGTVLVEAGLPLPALRPEQALVLAVTAVERPGFLR
jgi:alpha-galactosidase